MPSSANPTSTESSQLQLVQSRLQSHYGVRPLSRWALEHRLFRGAPLENASKDVSMNDMEKSQSSRSLQVLSISTQPRNCYVVITTPSAAPLTRARTSATSSSGTESNNEPANIISIPSGSQTEEFVQLIMTRLGPLWTSRQVLQVSQGLAFEVGDFRVRLGELKQGQSGTQQNKGVVVEIEWMSADDIDWSTTQGTIKSFWTSLGITNAKEYITVTGFKDNFGSIRQWCKALELRT